MRASVTHDSHSLYINGTPTLIRSGAFHYFRVHPSEWESTFALMKHAGLNTVETYIPWNMHERARGCYDFSGIRDVERFLSLAAKAGLYAIVRVGPYICAEWDFGGLPAFLLEEKGITVRTTDDAFMRAVTAWFDVLLPKIARAQCGVRGNVIALQIENEYDNIRSRFTEKQQHEKGDAYLAWLVTLVREKNITIPILTCLGHTEGTLEGVNDFSPSRAADEIRAHAPDAPLIATECFTGWYPTWSRVRATRSGKEMANETLRFFMKGGALLNYYLFRDGTNFERNGMYTATTEYTFHAPLAEGGGVREKYHEVKNALSIVKTFERIIAEGDATPATFNAEGVLGMLYTKGEERLLFVENTSDTATTLSLAPYTGVEKETTLPPSSVKAFPIRASLDSAGATYTLVNGNVLGLLSFGKKTTLIIYGDENARVDILFEKDGKKKDASYPVPQPGHLTQNSPLPGVHVIVMDKARAKATFIVDSTAKQFAIAGAYSLTVAKDGTPRVAFPTESAHIDVITEKGVKRQTVKAKALPTLPAPLWEKIGLPYEHVFAGKVEHDYAYIGAARDTLLDVHPKSDYGFYAHEVCSPIEGEGVLTLPATRGHISVFVNGICEYRDAVPLENVVKDEHGKKSITLPLEKGVNRVVVMYSHLGLVAGAWQLCDTLLVEKDGSYGMAREQRGIWGETTLTIKGKRVKLEDWYFSSSTLGYRDGFYRKEMQEYVRSNTNFAPSAALNWYRAFFTLSQDILDAAPSLLVKMDGMYKGALWMNGFPLGRYCIAETRDCHGETPFGAHMAKHGVVEDAMGSINQRTYYIPKGVLRNENVLVVFEEKALRPDSISLVWDTRHTPFAEDVRGIF